MLVAMQWQVRSYLRLSVLEFVLLNSTPTQIRQHVLCYHEWDASVDEFVRELTLPTRHLKHFIWDEVWISIMGLLLRGAVLLRPSCFEAQAI